MNALARVWKDTLDWYDEQPRWVRKTIDQTLHFFIVGGAPAALASGVASIWLSVVWTAVIGSVTGASVMATYELVQNLGDKNNDYVDMGRDLTFGVLGAICIGTGVAFRFA